MSFRPKGEIPDARMVLLPARVHDGARQQGFFNPFRMTTKPGSGDTTTGTLSFDFAFLNKFGIPTKPIGTGGDYRQDDTRKVVPAALRELASLRIKEDKVTFVSRQ